MIVKVRYKSHGGEFTSAEYAYNTYLPLVCGDMVLAPTYRGDSAAMVTETNVVPETLPVSVLSVLKEITNYAPEETDD